jgi:hypothetical protein
MMVDVRNSVLSETRGRQEPWDQSSLRARFCFVPETEEPKIEEFKGRLELSENANEWAVIQNTTSLAVLARFRERYPEPPWSEYADIRMKELRGVEEKRREIHKDQQERWLTLQQAILSAFNRDTLRMTVLNGLDRELDNIVPVVEPFDRQVLALIDRADHEGWLGELARALLEARVQNQRFVAVVRPIADQFKVSDQANSGRQNSRKLLRTLHQAILDAFNHDSLRMTLLEGTDRELYNIVPVGEPFFTQVFALIERANQEGWLAELVNALLDARKENQHFVDTVAPVKAEFARQNLSNKG